VAWFRVDDKLGEHPKVRAIPRTHRRNAMGLWLLAGAWCALTMRDGHVPPFMVDEWACEPVDAHWLAQVDLWHAEGHDCEACPQPRDADGWVFHEWSTLQPTKAEIEASARPTPTGSAPTASGSGPNARPLTVTHRHA
jgi:hypothetical protein